MNQYTIFQLDITRMHHEHSNVTKKLPAIGDQYLTFLEHFMDIILYYQLAPFSIYILWIFFKVYSDIEIYRESKNYQYTLMKHS